jgi:hypothetical protein
MGCECRGRRSIAARPPYPGIATAPRIVGWRLCAWPTGSARITTLFGCRFLCRPDVAPVSALSSSVPTASLPISAASTAFGAANHHFRAIFQC